MAVAPALLPIRSPGFVRLPPLVAAAEAAPVVGGRRGVSYHELPCRSALNRCTSERMPFEWTINPYRGCELACRYCYARYTHEYIGLPDTHTFETEIYAKTGAAEALERELSRGRPFRGRIAIGTATDPYQPAERTMKVTRRLLEVFARREGMSLSITTKSHLVVRDLDVLKEIASRNDLGVNVTITTLSRRLARLLEPRAPRPALRLEAVRALSEAGLWVGVFVMPIVPGLTDGAAALEALVAAASRAGAGWLAHQVLFLRDSAKREFYPFLAKHYPRLIPRYRRTYGASAYHTEEYRRRVAEVVDGLRIRYRLGSRPDPASPPCAERWADGAGSGDPTVPVAGFRQIRSGGARPPAQMSLGF